ncbi:serine hydrolase domain-containing protein [Terriglobus sp. RCC_193]|uniref:serine hydrolase domain-containing protein n=1 Tax=Terriglobus sp. RCC_193 TaxID=3239218 RepID=UPI0035241A5B
MRFSVLVLFLTCFFLPGYSQSQTLQRPAARWIKADQDIRTAITRYDVPGASIMVIEHGRIVWTHAYGKRDIQHNLAVQMDTHFEIGSITKQFTAVSILQLRDAGKLKLDDPLSVYLPDAPHAKEVTLRNLLTHTSGLHDYLDGPPAEIDRLAALPISYHDLLSRVAAMPLDFPPGSQWSYSNTGYLLLGKVIEVVSGEPYRDYIQQRILNPLGMRNTFTTADESHLPNMAIGYRHENGVQAIAPFIDPSWGSSAGFLISTPEDLSRWDAALHGGKVVSPASYREMTTAFMTTKNGSADYGFGLFVDSMYGQPRVGHTGGAQGFTAADEYFPEQDTRIIALTNSGDKTPEAGETLTNIVFADLYPSIAANALKPATEENSLVTQAAGAAFRELQTGANYMHFSSRLKDKFAHGSGEKFKTSLSPYGPASAAIFRHTRLEGGYQWYDYLILFGPGVSIPFSVRMDQDGVVAGFSIG